MTSEDPSRPAAPGPAGPHPKPAQERAPAPGAGAEGSAPADIPTPPAGKPPVTQPAGAPPSGSEPAPATRTGMAWAATIPGLVLLVLLIVFIAQNQVVVPLRYFGFAGNVNLGLALLVAAVAGGFVVAAVGGARILQLRAQNRGAGRKARRPR